MTEQISSTAPETYDAFTLPEGRTLDATVLEQLTPVFKEAGLDQGKAQKFVETHDTLLQKALQGMETKSVAPEKYNAFTLSEGRELDTKALELATPIFQKMGLSQEQAQEIVSIQDQVVAAQEKATADAVTAQNAAWDTEVKNDKTIDVSVAQEALAKLSDAETTKYLKDSGIGNHPGLLRIFTKVGAMLKEDGNIPGGTAGDTKADLGRIYSHPSSQVAAR